MSCCGMSCHSCVLVLVLFRFQVLEWACRTHLAVDLRLGLLLFGLAQTPTAKEKILNGTRQKASECANKWFGIFRNVQMFGTVLIVR